MKTVDIKKTLSLVFILIFTVLLFPLIEINSKSSDYGDNFGNSCSFSYEETENRLTISGNGNMPYQNGNETFPWSIYAGKAETVVIKSGVTLISSYSFADFSRLKNIVIENTVTEIAEYAFANCIALADLTIPDNIKKIGTEAFINCSSLSNINIPDSVTQIGMHAFNSTAYYNNSGNWLNGVLYINNHLIAVKNTINGHYTVKDGVKSIAQWAFFNCKKLTSVTIPHGIKLIDYGVFYECGSLMGITISEGVEVIGDSAFINCTSLKTVNLHSTLKSIEFYAFERCNSLTELKIPNSVTSIGTDVFKGCNNLTLTVKYGSYAHDYVNENNLKYKFDCPHKNSQRSGEVAASCTNNGKTGDLYCYDCGGIVEKSQIIYAAHKFDNKQIVKSPTCTQNGVEKGKCTVCGAEAENIIPQLNHLWSDWEIVKTSSCTSTGLDERRCAYCGETQQETYQATGHRFANSVTVRQPTANKEGLKESVCINCGYKHQETIPKLTIKDNVSSNKTTNTTLQYDVDFKVNQLGRNSPEYSIATNALKNITKNFLLFEIVATVNGVETDISLEKETKFDMTIPQIIGNNITVYHIDKNGNIEKIKASLGSDENKISVYGKKLGNYAVCLNLLDFDTPSKDLQKGITSNALQKIYSFSNKLIIAIIIAVAFILIISLILIILFKHKKHKNNPTL